MNAPAHRTTIDISDIDVSTVRIGSVDALIIQLCDKVEELEAWETYLRYGDTSDWMKYAPDRFRLITEDDGWAHWGDIDEAEWDSVNEYAKERLMTLAQSIEAIVSLIERKSPDREIDGWNQELKYKIRLFSAGNYPQPE